MSMSQVWYVGRITIAAAGAPIVSISDGAILWDWHSSCMLLSDIWTAKLGQA